MPGVKSLSEAQYYAHPRNVFWRIISDCFLVNVDVSYSCRTEILMREGIALWDVIACCDREGSLDSNIEEASIQMNPIPSFLDSHPSISTLLFNGGKAATLFRRYLAPLLIDGRKYTVITMPSTSPAHAAVSYDQKLSRWKLGLECVM